MWSGAWCRYIHMVRYRSYPDCRLRVSVIDTNRQVAASVPFGEICLPWFSGPKCSSTRCGWGLHHFCGRAVQLRSVHGDVALGILAVSGDGDRWASPLHPERRGRAQSSLRRSGRLRTPGFETYHVRTFSIEIRCNGNSVHPSNLDGRLRLQLCGAAHAERAPSQCQLPQHPYASRT